MSREDGWVGMCHLSVAVAVCTFLVCPLLVIFPMSLSAADNLIFPPTSYSFRNYQAVVQSSVWISAIIRSFQVATMAALVAMVLGVSASYALSRFRFPMKRLFYFLLLSPMVLPVIIIALGLFLTYAPFHLVGNPWFVALTHGLLGIPFVVIMTSAALRDFDVGYEQAAKSLGATSLQTFWKVVLPSIRTAIMAGALLAFAISFDELVIVLFLGGQGTITVPRQMWSGIHTALDPLVPVVSSFLNLLVCVIGALVLVLQRRRAR